MAPDDQVEEVRDEGLGDVVGGTPLGTILYTDQPLLIMTSEVITIDAPMIYTHCP
jgi:hypothetical protein